MTLLEGRTIVLTGVSTAGGTAHAYAVDLADAADKDANWLVRAIVDKPTRVSELPGVVISASRPLFRRMDRSPARRSRR